jgi:predicted Fe-Mo cluster-binding NifX family protein
VKICIPVAEDRGLQSPVYGHFGSAPLFVEVDTESLSVEALSNQDHAHVHGACNPMKAIAGRPLNAVLVGGIGPGALMGLRQAGIAVFLAPEGTVEDAIRLFNAGELPELKGRSTCGGHEQSGGCGCGER